MTESANTTEDSIFKKYEHAVRNLMGALSKERAIELSLEGRPGLISPSAIKKLFSTLNCEGWKNQKGQNWVWRDATPEHTKGHSDEVSLEREIAALDPKRWTCQMSTSSGVQVGLNKRRAIDLVRNIGENRYAFIELKVGSNNPLYGAFEILGYALAYLHAKEHRGQGKTAPDVFNAREIELTILGPESWYTYRKRGKAADFDFDLQWLAEDIENSLNAQKNAPKFSMVFRRFPDRPSHATDCALAIDKLARESWW